GDAARDRGGHPRPLRRGLRADRRPPIRPVPGGDDHLTRVVVTVMPRAGVLDPQGQAVGNALARLGFEGVRDVRVGRRIELEIEGDDPAGQATRMADELLANALIEDYRVEVIP